ncbi:MAG: glycosyltransferase family 4 protein [Bacteroidota bacterium]|nr:glycosyltransferase family 4 protein [Bacteroidota bacterium]
MHVIHIVNHFLPSAGGVEWSVLRTAEAQVLRGDSVTVITETPRGGFHDSALPFTVRRFQVPLRRPITRLYYWRWMWRQRALLRAADVLHFHDYTPLVHWFLPLRPLLRGPCYAITFHGFENWPVRLRHRLLRALAARMCHIRFAVGDYVREIYGHPVDQVYLGAPVRNYSRMTPSEAMRFVFVGRLEADTGVLEFTAALAAAAAEMQRRVQLEIAGDGSLRPRLEDLRGPWMDISFHGRVEDPLQLYARARFVVASGFLSMLEAFQTGLPVLFPALDEIKRRYVASVPEADTLLTVMRSREELHRILRAALSRELQAQFSARAERALTFVSEHTWRDIADLLASGYEKGNHREGGARSTRIVVHEKH